MAEENKTTVRTVSTKFSTLLAVALIILKATGTIGMGWFWVITSLIWIPIVTFVGVTLFTIAVVAALALLAGGAVGAKAFIDSNKKPYRTKRLRNSK